MKKLLTIALICCSCFAVAQPYQSIFGRDSTSWFVKGTCGNNGVPSAYYARYKSVNQQSISGKYYHKFLSRSGNSLIDSFFVREDATLGKIWLRHLLDTLDERLVVDFNLQIGDSFFHLEGGIRTVVDSIYYINGKKIIRFERMGPSAMEKIKFIEGIGSNLGLAKSIIGSLYCRSGELQCVEKDGVLAYYNPFDPWACGVYKISEVQSTTAKKIITNTQVSDMLCLNKDFLAKAKETNFVIIDITGKILQQGTVQGLCIPVGDIAPGIYLIKVISGNYHITERFSKM